MCFAERCHCFHGGETFALVYTLGDLMRSCCTYRGCVVHLRCVRILKLTGCTCPHGMLFKR